AAPPFKRLGVQALEKGRAVDVDVAEHAFDEVDRSARRGHTGAPVGASLPASPPAAPAAPLLGRALAGCRGRRRRRGPAVTDLRTGRREHGRRQPRVLTGLLGDVVVGEAAVGFGSSPVLAPLERSLLGTRTGCRVRVRGSGLLASSSAARTAPAPFPRWCLPVGTSFAGLSLGGDFLFFSVLGLDREKLARRLVLETVEI